MAPSARIGLGLLLVLAVASCGGSDSKEPQPGAVRIAKAVVKGLLSNSVEAKESEPAPAPPPAAPAPLFAEAEAPQTCEIPYSGPVTIIPVRSPTVLQRSVASRPSRELVYETDDTAIFEDGRVLTTDLESVGTHLNAVGWSTNPMKIMGASVRPGGSSRNLGWASAENSDGATPKKQKKRRRRG